MPATEEPFRARSLLFAPGDSDRKMEKAAASAADIALLDLEDAVAPSAKVTCPVSGPSAVAPAARATVAERCSVAPAERGLTLLERVVVVTICATVSVRDEELLRALSVSPW